MITQCSCLRALRGVPLALAAAGAAAELADQADDFPEPFPAGGGTDVRAADRRQLSEQLGQQALIENQGGAGGTVGAANAAKRPDGYNWFFGAVHHDRREPVRPAVLQPGARLRAGHGGRVRARTSWSCIPSTRTSSRRSRT